MNDVNRQLKAILPQRAMPIAALLKGMPRRRAGSAIIPSMLGIAGAGVLVGVAIGLLVAPQNGKELRQQLTASVERDERLRELWGGPRRAVLFVEGEALAEARAVIGEAAPIVSGKIGGRTVYVFTNR